MIKSWKLFLENKEDYVADICKEYGIKNWSINPGTGLVDVDGNVNCFPSLQNILYKGKIPLNFGKVSGNFDCSNNKLTTLKGCPYEVGGDFNCYHSTLISLEGVHVK